MNFNIELRPVPLPNLAPIMLDLPDPILAYLNGVVDDILTNPDNYEAHNSRLAGHLKSEYWMEFNQDFQDLVVGIGHEYLRINQQSARQLRLESTWVNLQRKHEFNPVHNHDGHLSFVIWLRVPYRLADEMNMFPEARGRRTSQFEFAYTSIIGHHCTTVIPVDNDWQGRMCMFPAALPHSVYPFYTSDDLRVSISGNLA